MSGTVHFRVASEGRSDASLTFSAYGNAPTVHLSADVLFWGPLGRANSGWALQCASIKAAKGAWSPPQLLDVSSPLELE